MCSSDVVISSVIEDELLAALGTDPEVTETVDQLCGIRFQSAYAVIDMLVIRSNSAGDEVVSVDDHLALRRNALVHYPLDIFRMGITHYRISVEVGNHDVVRLKERVDPRSRTFVCLKDCRIVLRLACQG